MADNGKDLREAVAETLMVEPGLTQAEVELLSSETNGLTGKLRQSMQQLLEDAPIRPTMDGFMSPNLEPQVVKSLRAAFEEALNSNATLAEAETSALNDLGLEKLGEVRTSIRGHLSGEAELADRDLAIYVKARDGRKTAFQRALEENLKDLGERPPFERGTPTKVQDGGSRPQAPSLPESSVGEPAGEVERIDSPKSVESLSESPESGPSKVKSVTFKPALPASSDGGVQSTSAREQSAPSLPRMEPLPLLTAALEAVGFAEDEFGFVLRYGRYAQPGRNSEFLVGGLGLSDLSDRLAGWLEAQGANNCEVQVLDEGSGELKIYLLGHDRPLALPEAGIELT